MIYLDTSVIVPLIVPETTSSRARSWFDRLDFRNTKDLAVSAWVLTEFTSAMGIKVRNRDISGSQGEAARALLEDALLPNMTVVEVTPTDFRLAETMLREFSLGLRDGDALHLATAPGAKRNYSCRWIASYVRSPKQWVCRSRLYLTNRRSAIHAAPGPLD